jgi:serine/threonine protein kinase
MIETVPSGTVLNGRYRIERVLGSGGFGHVYLASDLTTNQQYALKEYLISGPGGQEQLMHEANVLSQLNHPNLPAFHDAFTERGHYYVILNYIEGEDLTDIIRLAHRRNEVVPITKILTWILTTSDAVLFLHNQNPPVIHRDIKPDNIRIMPDGTAILVDLGNAKAYADGLRTLIFIRHQGTPGYAPPEQYPGGSGTDARSDVYALGATLYFALVAHEPPSVSTRNQALQQRQPDLPSLQELLANNPPESSLELNEAKQFRLGVSKPTKPAPRHSRHMAQLGTLPPQVLTQLNSIIHRSMAMRPKDRYQHVADFMNDLNRVAVAVPQPVQQVPQAPNPYSTQPDLPMLYEALQEAKANSNQGFQQNAAGTFSCPRCHATVMQNAPFCPNCELSFTRTAPTPSKSVQPHLGDRTITAPPHVQQTPRAHVPASTPPPVSSGKATQSDASIWDTTPVTPQKPTRPSTSSNQAMQQQQQQATSTSSGFTIGPGLVIGILVILVILILIMAVLLISHFAHVTGLVVPTLPY